MYKIDRRGGGSKNRSLGQTLEIKNGIFVCFVNEIYVIKFYPPTF